MKTLAAILFALLLPATAFAAEQSLPPMSQNAISPAGDYMFQPSDHPEGGGRWTRTAPHPAAKVDVDPIPAPAAQIQNPPAAGGRNPFADPQYTAQQNADPAAVTQPPAAAENADAPEVAPPRMTSQGAAPAPMPAYRDPNPPVVSTGGGTWSLPQTELDAMAGRAPGTGAPAQAQAQQPTQAMTGMQSMSVTPIEKCLSQLPPAEAAEVRMRFVKPYEECQNRLGANARQQKTVEAGKQAEALAPETPRNYIRVAAPPEAPAKDNSTASQGDASGRSYIDISGNSKAKLNP